MYTILNSFVLFSCYLDEEALPLDPDEINPFEDFEGDGKKIGKKKMMKLQAKEEKRQQRLVYLIKSSLCLFFFFTEGNFVKI